MNVSDAYVLSRWLYSIGELPLMDDMEYNRLHKQYLSEGLMSEYTSRSWSSDPCPVDLLKEYGLSKFIKEVSLGDKTESIESLLSENDISRYYGTDTDKYHASFKIDGWNVQATYFRGERLKVQTRGRKSDALDVSQVAKLLPEKIPIHQETRIVFELCISDSNFIELRRRLEGTDIRSQRASVRTCLANSNLLHLLTPLAFDIQSVDDTYTAEETFVLLKEWGFQTSYGTILEGNYAEVLKAVEILSQKKESYGFPTDGVVIRRNVSRDLKAIRIQAWQERDYTSFITGIEEEHSSSNLGCKLLIYPVRTEHSIQRRVNITNLNRIITYKLLPGSPIVFSLRSDAIADINLQKTLNLQEAYGFNSGAFQDLIKNREQMKEYRRELNV